MAKNSNRRRRDYPGIAKSPQSLPTSNVQLFNRFAQPIRLTLPEARHRYAIPLLDYFPATRDNGRRGINTHVQQRQNQGSRQNRTSPDRFAYLRSFPRQEKAIETFRQGSPRKMTLCERRDERTEVLHALGHTGKTGQKSPVWTRKSRIKC